MYCAQCGTENSDDAKFCKACGNPLQMTDEAKTTERESPSTEMREKTSRGYSIIAAILFAVLAVYDCVIRTRLINESGNASMDFLTIVYWAILLAFAVVMFYGKRNIPLVIVAGANALLRLYDSVTYSSSSNTIYFLSAAALTVIAAIVCIPSFAAKGSIVKKIWFLPAAILCIEYIIFRLYYFGYLLDYISLNKFILWFQILRPIVNILAYFFVGIWLVPSTRRNAASSSAKSGKISNEAYCGLVKHILLLLFTFGIWQLIWIYRVTGFTNAVKDEEDRNPVTKLLLCIFIPFYFWYWTYKTAQRIDKLAATNGVSSDLGALCLILSIFVPIIPPILMQDKINSIVTAG